jgi:hypothetical protein
MNVIIMIDHFLLELRFRISPSLHVSRIADATDDVVMLRWAESNTSVSITHEN